MPGRLTTAVAKVSRLRMQIVKRSDQNGFVVLPRRWVAERTFSWLGPTGVSARTWRTSRKPWPPSSPSPPSSLSSGGLPGSRSISAGRGAPVRCRRRTAVVGSLKRRSPAPTGTGRMRRKRPSGQSRRSGAYLRSRVLPQRRGSNFWNNLSPGWDPLVARHTDLPVPWSPRRWL